MDAHFYQSVPRDEGTEGLALFAARDEALERVEQGAGAAWMEGALAVLEQVARDRLEFTVMRCRALYTDPPEPRAWGAVLVQGERRGWIEGTDRHVNAGSHGRPLRVWRSLLHPAARRAS